MAIKGKKAKISGQDKGIIKEVSKDYNVKRKFMILAVLAIIGIFIITSVVSVVIVSDGKNNNLNQNATNSVDQSQVELSKNAVIFFHAEWCSHCQAMKHIVNELIQAGYPIVNAEVSTEIGKQIASKYPNIHSVPTFICYGNGKTKTGEQTKDALVAFINECKIEK